LLHGRLSESIHAVWDGRRSPRFTGIMATRLLFSVFRAHKQCPGRPAKPRFTEIMATRLLFSVLGAHKQCPGRPAKPRFTGIMATCLLFSVLGTHKQCPGRPAKPRFTEIMATCLLFSVLGAHKQCPGRPAKPRFTEIMAACQRLPRLPAQSLPVAFFRFCCIITSVINLIWLVLRGWVRFPTGGTVRNLPMAADPVRFRDRQ
jgi:TM2 domain-containing membrane protein YozV